MSEFPEKNDNNTEAIASGDTASDFTAEEKGVSSYYSLLYDGCLKLFCLTGKHGFSWFVLCFHSSNPSSKVRTLKKAYLLLQWVLLCIHQRNFLK